MAYSPQYLFLASGVNNGEGFWIVGIKNCDKNILEDKNILDCYRKELIGNESAKDILVAINLNINNLLDELKNKNYFIETAKNFNNLYGSPFTNIHKSNKRKQHLLFDIDWKGARKIRKNYKKEDIIDFFILPPSKSELKRRLVKRGRDNKKEINLRLSYAIDEMKHYSEYQYVLINEKVHKTVNEIKKIIEYHQLIMNQKEFLKKKLKKIIDRN